MEVEVHLAKEGQVISKDSKSQAKLMHGIQVVMARNYIENLREEVRKGMREKAEQGVYPSRPPIGYRNNKLERSIEIDPERAPIACRMFELYATGQHSLRPPAMAARPKHWRLRSAQTDLPPIRSTRQVSLRPPLTNTVAMAWSSM